MIQSYLKGAFIAAAVFLLPGLSMAGNDLPTKSVAEVHAESQQLAGKRIHLSGKVVKVNNGIMGKNFLHIQDGSGSEAEGNHDITVTSQQTANVGDQLNVEALVTVNRDFGFGYSYALILEEAKLSHTDH